MSRESRATEAPGARPSWTPEEAPRIAYRAEVAIALDGSDRWSLDRLVSRDAGRWNRPGQPTTYFATDPGVALAELGRHAPDDGPPPKAFLWTLRLSLEGLSDLRGAPNEVVLDPEQCRAFADDARSLGLPGLVVPSVAFLDKRDRFNVVIFADVLGARSSDVIEAPRLLGAITPT